MILLLAIIVFGGYLLPLPFAVAAWREWFRMRANARPHKWRRAASATALLALTAVLPLWVYAAVQELRNNYSYIYPSAQIGRWSSLVLFFVSCFAEGRCRTFLLLAAAGLLFFYGGTIGELP